MAYFDEEEEAQNRNGQAQGDGRQSRTDQLYRILRDKLIERQMSEADATADVMPISARDIQNAAERDRNYALVAGLSNAANKIGNFQGTAAQSDVGKNLAQFAAADDAAMARRQKALDQRLANFKAIGALKQEKNDDIPGFDEPDSSVSSQYQDLAGRLLPGGNFKGLSARQIKSFLPQASQYFGSVTSANVKGTVQDNQNTRTERQIEAQDARNEKNLESAEKLARIAAEATLRAADAKRQAENEKEAKANEKQAQKEMNKNIENIAEASAEKGKLIDRFGEALQLYDEAGATAVGPVGGRLTGIAGAVGVAPNEAAARLDAKMKQALNAYIKLMTGTAAGVEEMKRLSAVMPAITDSRDRFVIKSSEVVKEAEAIVRERQEKMRVEQALKGRQAQGAPAAQPAPQRTFKKASDLPKIGGK